MLVSYYIKIYKSPFLFLLHLSALYLLFFFASCSLIVCVVRDPGAVKLEDDMGQRYDVEIESEDDDDDTDILSALRMEESKPRKPVKDDPDFNAPHKWCRKCWAPKPVSCPRALQGIRSEFLSRSEPTIVRHAADASSKWVRSLL